MKSKIKKRYSKKGKVAIIINLVVILGCTCFYTYRLFYFYKVEHPDVLENETIVDMLQLDSKTVTSGDGLYKDDSGYYFKGENVNNYVKYSSRIWRIVSVDENYSVKLISDDPQTSLAYGYTNNFKESEVYKYLNDETYLNGSYYKTLDKLNYLVTTKSNINDVDDNQSNNIDSNVGLLSYQEYKKTGSNSYLNEHGNYWISNSDGSSPCYLTKKGKVKESDITQYELELSGIRPTITLSGSVVAKNGDGSENNPFNLDSNSGTKLVDKSIGTYVSIDSEVFRVIGRDDDGIKVALNGVIKDDNSQDIVSDYGTSNYYTSSQGIGRYMNYNYYTTLSETNLVNYYFNDGGYDSYYQYSLDGITTYKEPVNCGFMQVGDLFINDVSNVFLGTRESLTYQGIYYIDENGLAKLGTIGLNLNLRPVVCLSIDSEVASGSGSQSDPYVLK